LSSKFLFVSKFLVLLYFVSKQTHVIGFSETVVYTMVFRVVYLIHVHVASYNKVFFYKKKTVLLFIDKNKQDISSVKTRNHD